MKDSQLYIGTPNGVMLCFDRKKEGRFDARFYTNYSREPVKVESFEQLLFQLEAFFDELQFPYATTNSRSFQGETTKSCPPARKEKIMKDEELLTKHGDLGSFIIRVQHRQNSSWQGRITWVEKNQTMMFRSVWEMIKLMESALNWADPDEKAEEPGWQENN